jgi:hypothetical protein
MRISFASVIAQLVAYAAFALVVGYLSNRPSYQHHDPELGLIKISFHHAGKPIRECRRLTVEEIAALPPNMRRPTDCPRQRVPLAVEIDLDEKALYRAKLAPTGLAEDGPASAYARFPVPPGIHAIKARLRDSRRESGFDYQQQRTIEISPNHILVIDFREDLGGFLIGRGS